LLESVKHLEAAHLRLAKHPTAAIVVGEGHKGGEVKISGDEVIPRGTSNIDNAEVTRAGEN